jgi:PST family polysaccharide transporter
MGDVQSGTVSATAAAAETAAGPTTVRGAGLGRHAARSFAVMMAQALTMKVVGFAGQVMLAWYLSRADFGLVSMAYTVTIFTGLIHQMGLREVLVRRHPRFRNWSGPGIGMSMTGGLVAGVLVAVAAPVAARVYGAPELVGLLWVLAISQPLTALGNVPEAWLRGELRFTALSKIGAITTVSQVGLSVLFARLGYGAYSFVLPQPITMLMGSVLYWVIGRPPVRWHSLLRHWRYMLTDSAAVFTARVLVMVTAQADYAVLGLMRSEQVVGVYFFAFNLSMQTLQMLIYNFSGILSATLRRLDEERGRQVQAFLRATEAMAVIGIPLCFLQAAAADPGVRALYKPEWYEAIPVLQVLSVGMAFRLPAMLAGEPLSARGHFRSVAGMNGVEAAGYVLTVLVAAYAGGALSVAVAAAVFFGVGGPLKLRFVTRADGGRWSDVGRIYYAPMGVGAAAGAAAMGAGALVPAGVPGRQWVRLAVTCLVMAGVYLPGIRFFAPTLWDGLAARVRDAVRRKRGGGVPAAPEAAAVAGAPAGD